MTTLDWDFHIIPTLAGLLHVYLDLHLLDVEHSFGHSHTIGKAYGKLVVSKLDGRGRERYAEVEVRSQRPALTRWLPDVPFGLDLFRRDGLAVKFDFELVNLDQQMEFRHHDADSHGDAVLGVDINGDGRIDPSADGGERFGVYEPFTIGERTFRVEEVDPYLPRVVFREVVKYKVTESAATVGSVGE